MDLNAMIESSSPKFHICIVIWLLAGKRFVQTLYIQLRYIIIKAADRRKYYIFIGEGKCKFMAQKRSGIDTTQSVWFAHFSNPG